MIPYNCLVVYVLPTGRKHVKRLREGEDWHTAQGILAAASVHNAVFGSVVNTSLGMPVRVEEATFYDILMSLKRQTQIIYPKDVAYICLRLGAGPGKIIAEAGCGSGGLTAALSWYCGPTGKVFSQDNREEFIKLARRNLDWAGLGENVELRCQDIVDGFIINNADALFLDVREPWLYLKNALNAVKGGATLGFLLPTTNQIVELLRALEKGPFAEIEVCEILVRNWKPVPDRFRPNDRMVAHTSFLLFCRQQEQSKEFDEFMAPGTRERKQLAAREQREKEEEG